MEKLNQTDFSNNAINNSECSFPKTKNNYKGGTVESFQLPADMPATTTFDDVTVTPTACVSLKLKRLSNNQKVFINIVCHSDVPNFPISDPYIYLANERSFQNKDGEEGLVCDAAVHDSVWTVATTDDGALVMRQVCYLDICCMTC